MAQPFSNIHSQIVRDASHLGRVDVSLYALDNGCPWDWNVFQNANDSARTWAKEKACLLNLD